MISFISGRPSNFRDKTNVDWKPSVNLGKDSVKEKRRAIVQSKRHARRMKRASLPAPQSRQTTRSVSISLAKDIESEEDLDLPEACESGTSASVSCEIFIPIDCGTQTDNVIFENPQKQCSEIGTQTEMSSHDINDLVKEINDLKNEISYLRLELSKAHMKSVKVSDLNEEVLSKDDKLVKFYTGIVSFNLLMVFYNLVQRNVEHNSAKNVLTKFSEFLIVMMKLRLNVPFQDLAVRFNVSFTTVQRIFSKWINGMYKDASRLIIWPDREVRCNSMPDNFKKLYGNRVAAIIDCFEIFTEKAAAPKASSETWSHYKNHHTVKYLISILPQGSINFISKAFVGRASDKQITAESGFYQYLEPGDLVMADRGFRIDDDLLPMGCRVVMPAFTKGLDQLSYEDCTSTRELANLRIHVERIIGMLRNKFPILASTLPIDFINTKPKDPMPIIDKIVIICCAVINICPSIVQE
jgi:hypothetical protein